MPAGREVGFSPAGRSWLRWPARTFRSMSAFLAAALTAALSALPVVAPIGWGNGLTLPAQRHVVRLEPPGRPPYLLVAVQEDHNGPGGLNFWRSDDGGATWRFEAPVQPDPSHRDTADLVRVGDDVAIVWSWEGPDLAGDARSDVWFQWWRMDPVAGALVPQAPVRVFDSTSSATAYHRAELVLDSVGRLWVLAFFMEADGTTNDVLVSVSEDGGATFAAQPVLDRVSPRGGGRIA